MFFFCGFFLSMSTIGQLSSDPSERGLPSLPSGGERAGARQVTGQHSAQRDGLTPDGDIYTTVSPYDGEPVGHWVPLSSSDGGSYDTTGIVDVGRALGQTDRLVNTSSAIVAQPDNTGFSVLQADRSWLQEQMPLSRRGWVGDGGASISLMVRKWAIIKNKNKQFCN
jgi:hypothetical protein